VEGDAQGWWKAVKEVALGSYKVGFIPKDFVRGLSSTGAQAEERDGPSTIRGPAISVSGPSVPGVGPASAVIGVVPEVRESNQDDVNENTDGTLVAEEGLDVNKDGGLNNDDNDKDVGIVVN